MAGQFLAPLILGLPYLMCALVLVFTGFAALNCAQNGQLVFSHTLHKEAVRKISTSVPVRHGARTIKQVGWHALEQLCCNVY